MGLLNSIITWMIKKRIHQMDLFRKYPLEVQQELFKNLIQTASQTEFGKRYKFRAIENYQQYREIVPLHTYESFFPFIEKVMHGQQNVIWPSEIKWFSKSSGTTNSRSKFIPVSQESMEDCHFKAGKDLLSIYVNNHEDTKIFDGKGLTVGGSHQINEFDPSATSYYGDVSAVLMQNLPHWAQFIRTPSLETALMNNWEEKIERMIKETRNENVTHLAGVPTWIILLLERLIKEEGAKSILEIWPNLEVFFHGAVSFTPYRNLFKTLIPNENMRYYDTYNASEGFFAIQDQNQVDELLLMLDYGIFYEFIPCDELDRENPKALCLAEVSLGVNYAMVISTNSGLWRYIIGDTVKFTSLYPFRIKITGRTKHFINVFGEEVIIENAEQAIAMTCEQYGTIVNNFTVAPIFFQQQQKGGHEWIIELKERPKKEENFRKTLDQNLRAINSDYDAKRQGNLALMEPVIHFVDEGTFYSWLKKKGKLGGQNKVPRLSNTREYVEEILSMVREK